MGGITQIEVEELAGVGQVDLVLVVVDRTTATALERRDCKAVVREAGGPPAAIETRELGQQEDPNRPRRVANLLDRPPEDAVGAVLRGLRSEKNVDGRLRRRRVAGARGGGGGGRRAARARCTPSNLESPGPLRGPPVTARIRTLWNDRTWIRSSSAPRPLRPGSGPRDASALDGGAWSLHHAFRDSGPTQRMPRAPEKILSFQADTDSGRGREGNSGTQVLDSRADPVILRPRVGQQVKRRGGGTNHRRVPIGTRMRRSITPEVRQIARHGDGVTIARHRSRSGERGSRQSLRGLSGFGLHTGRSAWGILRRAANRTKRSSIS